MARERNYSKKYRKHQNEKPGKNLLLKMLIENDPERSFYQRVRNADYPSRRESYRRGYYLQAQKARAGEAERREKGD